jgi:biofilm PGA synthesis protein PgaA
MRKRVFLLTAALLLGYSHVPQVIAADTNLSDARTMYERDPLTEQNAYNYALMLARNGQFPLSLEIFKKLAVSTANPAVLYDYAVVLTWADNYGAAINVYEQQIRTLKGQLPSYAANSIAGAYYRTGNYSEAQKLYHISAESGDMQAKRWEAESLMRMNRIFEANQIYEELIFKSPADAENYLSRASMLILAGDTVSAALDVDKALTLISDTPEGQEKRQKIRSDMAVAFIQSGDCSKGIVLLQPLIADKSASMKNQANYIFALRLNGDYKLAISEAGKLWPEYKNVPDFGLQALADAYLHTHELVKAISIYDVILQRNNSGTNLQAIKLGKGFAYMEKGDFKQGTDLYRAVLAVRPEHSNIMADDAAYFMQHDNINAGKELYESLLKIFPDNELYLKQYAALLAGKEMPREAFREYRTLNSLKNGALVGMAGMVNTAAEFGDYKTAAGAAKYLSDHYAGSAIAGQAINKYQAITRGSQETGFSILEDYKGNDVKTENLSASYHLDGRFTVLVGSANKKVSDEKSSTTLRTNSAGVEYQDVKLDAALWLDKYNIGRGFSSYHFTANHYFDDWSKLGIQVGRLPIEDSEALLQPVMATNYQLSFEHRFNRKDMYNIALTSSKYSDGNHSAAIDAEFTHTMAKTEEKQLDWFLSLSRLGYKQQQINGEDTVYESPEVREAYSFGVKQKWAGPRSYWETTLSAVWDRDRPEEFGFSPSGSVEYGYDFSKYSSLVFGGAYGFHTNVDSKKLGFGFRQYYINYCGTW